MHKDSSTDGNFEAPVVDVSDESFFTRLNDVSTCHEHWQFVVLFGFDARDSTHCSRMSGTHRFNAAAEEHRAWILVVIYGSLTDEGVEALSADELKASAGSEDMSDSHDGAFVGSEFCYRTSIDVETEGWYKA